jgi:fatty acid omega-hydroxylase
MTRLNGGLSSRRGFISATARTKGVTETAQQYERSAMANLTPWQQALLYENRANPYPFYAELRKTPVSRQPDGSYVVSTYREIASILHDPRVSSDLRNRPNATAAPEVAVYELGMITSDPPEHDRVRRATMRHFGPPHSPELVSSQEVEIKRIVAGLLDKLKGKKRVDVVDDFAYPLPVTVICEVLGVPRQDEARFHAWIEARLDGIDVGPEAASEEQQRLRERANQAGPELRKYLGGLLEKYAKQPGPGMLSAMVNDKSEEHLSHAELLSNAALLLFAGHETTVNLIAGGTLALLRNPAQLALLRADPALATGAVEELLRYDSPVQASRRITLEPVSIRGTTIPAGAFVMASLGSANRDELYWGSDAAEVRLTRANAHHHVSFGAGPHHCLGASLARLEASIALSRLVTRFPALALDGDVTWNGRINLRGPAHLPVRVR